MHIKIFVEQMYFYNKSMTLNKSLYSLSFIFIIFKRINHFNFIYLMNTKNICYEPSTDNLLT